ncbi:hypothetical protein [Methylobacterium nigriterrae]|uniref:hypothetical protein n=1 Tax=Methylobacterium nigriterrae TaxID=3127512 RepID=UPI003013E38A
MRTVTQPQERTALAVAVSLDVGTALPLGSEMFTHLRPRCGIITTLVETPANAPDVLPG